MEREEADSRCLVRCRSCDEIYVATVRIDEALSPVGVAECSCGDGDFRRIDA